MAVFGPTSSSHGMTVASDVADAGFSSSNCFCSSSFLALVRAENLFCSFSKVIWPLHVNIEFSNNIPMSTLLHFSR